MGGGISRQVEKQEGDVQARQRPSAAQRGAVDVPLDVAAPEHAGHAPGDEAVGQKNTGRARPGAAVVVEVHDAEQGLAGVGAASGPQRGVEARGARRVVADGGAERAPRGLEEEAGGVGARQDGGEAACEVGQFSARWVVPLPSSKVNSWPLEQVFVARVSEASSGRNDLKGLREYKGGIRAGKRREPGRTERCLP